jgi:superfamily II DNA or RNA helicase
VPTQSPRIPSPADLARVRVPPAPPQPPRPSRSRRLAEIEKERARRALQSLVADPAADFAALDADEFSAALKCACQEGTPNATLVAEAGRRLASGAPASRDLHQVLLTCRDDGEWSHARRLAMDAVTRRPHLAVEVVNLEIQRLHLSPMRVTESVSDQGFAARASLERDGVAVEGDLCFDTSKKRAGHKAAVSLLAGLARIPLPEPGQAGDACPGRGPSPTRARGAAPPATATGRVTSPATTAAAATSAMSPADVEAWLDHMVGRPEPDGELAGQLAVGRLTPRSLYLLLFEASPRGWERHRTSAWNALLAAPAQAPGVLSMHAQARSWPPPAYAETPGGAAVAYVVTRHGPAVGEPAVASGTRAARAAAALALIRDLAPPVGGDGPPEPPARGGSPISSLNERAQLGVIAELVFEHDVEGPAHRPVFTCTASCVHASVLRTGSAEAASKNEAKAGAAAGLLDEVLAAERRHLARLASTRREQARSPEGIFTRLLRAGCPVDHTGPCMRVGGGLPHLPAGHELPLLSALPILATLDGPAHPSARAWSTAARAALDAVAARRVYPALDADGKDCWRLAPEGTPDPATARFHDTVADMLLRPPGARLVIGDLPYAAGARPLGPDAASWADRAADDAEATAAAPLVIRLRPPDGDGRPLGAELRAVRADGSAAGGTQEHRGSALGRAEERLVRRAARHWPPLGRVAREETLSGAEAAELLGPVGERLAGLGITAEWPAGLVTASGLGAHLAVAPSSHGGSGAFSPTSVADLTWRFSLDGEPLTDEETAAAAEAVAGVLRIRGRWVVIDAETRRRARGRHAGHLTGAQALGAALTGRLAVAGADVACRGTGRLAELVATLRDPARGPQEGIAVPDGLNATLRDYQRRAVQWLVRMASAGFGALLADDMGLGKTLSVIAFRLSRESAGPSLVVCPASLVANWEREFARFAPSVTVRRYHSARRSLDGLASDEVVVTTYQTLLRDADALAGVPWDLVVADEAQQVKNHRCQAARALRLLRPAARVAVTGTPVENSLSELWAILDWTNPGLFGSHGAFRERFGRAVEQEAAGIAADRDAARRLGRLVSPFILRRRKTDPTIAPELPDKVVNDRYVELSREQAALYEAVTAQALERIAASDGLPRRGQVLRLLQSLRQICNSPAHYLRESPNGWDAAAQAARSGKLGVLDELMEAVVLSGDAALIFTGYVSMGHLLHAHLSARGIRADFLHGGVPLATRQQLVDRFQAGERDAFILSVRAAGTGLNLTRAGHVIHFDRPWNPAVEDQATDRAHRLGQHRLVEVHHLIAEGTVEDRIAGLLARKRELTEAVLAEGETALTELADGELAALVSLGTGTGEEGTR